MCVNVNWSDEGKKDEDEPRWPGGIDGMKSYSRARYQGEVCRIDGAYRSLAQALVGGALYFPSTQRRVIAIRREDSSKRRNIISRV